MRLTLAGLALSVALGIAGCKGPSAFACESNDQCTLAGEPGTCQPNGHCSYPDPGCPSGQSYPEGSGGGLGGTCVEPGETETGSSTSTSTSTSTSSTSTDTGSETVGQTSTEGSSESSTGSGCEASVSMIAWAGDSVVLDPMQLHDPASIDGLPELPNGAVVAFSEVAGAGSIDFDFDTGCPGAYYFWGLVWDIAPDPNTDNPDSFSVGMDELLWHYGCQTVDQPAKWSWLRIEDCPNGGDPYVRDSVDGLSKLSLTNVEAGVVPDVAAIAAVVASTDPNHDPLTNFDPGDP